MTKTFAERCQLAQQFLPDAQYKAMLTALHTEMLAALAEQPAPAAQGELVAWRVKVETKLRDGSVDGGYQTRNEKLSKHDEPLYTTPQAQPAPEIAIADAYRAGVDSGIAAEREACAQVCDDWAKTSYLSEAKSCAKIIRARGNT